MTMPTSPDSIVVGKCYLTTASEVREVLKIDGAWVDYVRRGKKVTPGWEKGPHYQTTLRKFGGEVVPCSCDWDAS
jgi:hypothetical protein